MIRTAVVGLGKMGMSHLAILKAHPEVEIAAICDAAGYVLGVLNKQMGFRTYSDYSRMLQEVPLDAVVIATPTRLHSVMVRQALEKGLHVFCEKPFSLDPAEGEALAAFAQSRGVVNQVGYHYRFVAAFSEAKRLLASGAIGKVHHIRAEGYGAVVLRPQTATWRSSATEGGGCLYDYACHVIDLIGYVFAPPTGVSGTVLRSVFSSEVDDEVYATLHFDHGASGQLAANWTDESYRKMAVQLTLWGSHGRMRVDRQEIQLHLNQNAEPIDGLNRGWNVRYTTELTQPVWYYLRGEEYSAQIDAFVRDITSSSSAGMSSFASAIATDQLVAQMIADARAPRSAVPASIAEPPRANGKGAGSLMRLLGLGSR